MKWLPVLAVLLLFGCASSYKKIYPKFVYFHNKTSLAEDVDIYYSYDVQYDVNNKKYHRHEKQSNLTAIALRIDNRSASTIVLSPTNLTLKTQMGRIIPLVDSDTYIKRVRQRSENYLWHALWGVNFRVDTESNPGEARLELGYSLPFLFISLGNVAFSEISNARFKKNIEQELILGKPILPGKTEYGILLIPENNYPEIVFEYKD
jgi:hypothetical protein